MEHFWQKPISRRRTLAIFAGAATALVAGRSRAAQAPRLFEWTGTALGAKATIKLYAGSAAYATEALDAAAAEIERLENEFSLYRPISALSRLNRDGRLLNPSLDMRYLLTEAVRFGKLSGGAFDVTVQPLWDLYATHFSRYPEDISGPPAEVVARAVRLVDYRRIQLEPDRIMLPSGMAVTLNGIAQGYLTDRVADLLSARGWNNVLVNLGELRGLGAHPDGRPWTTALPSRFDAHHRAAMIPLSQRAIATSSGVATRFEATGRCHHLFSPASGRSARTYAAVTVAAPRATVADALSTALYVAPLSAAEPMLSECPGVEAWLWFADGSVEHLG
jgi:thiamine biosynthesis lipoprotein